MTGPKRQHYVPRVYLDRFARDERVFVRRRDGGTFVARCLNVAVESGFYDIGTDYGPPSKVVEQHLANLEGLAAEVFLELDETGLPPARGTFNREVLAAYLALQFTRTPEQRERVLFSRRLAEFLAGRALSLDLVSEYLTRIHLRFKPSEREAQGAFDFASMTMGRADDDVLTPEFSIEVMLRSVERLVPVIDAMHWTVERDRKGGFFTSDSPLVIWRPPGHRDKYEGVGIGNAQEIRFPLDPTKQLVLSRQQRAASVRITSERAHRCNLDVAAGCHRFIVAHPRQEQRCRRLPLNSYRPVVRFDKGPLYRREPGGREVFVGEVLHTWVPRR